MEPRRLTVTVEEAGQLLGISRAKAYECARTGELPTKRFGKRMVVSLDALLRLLDIAEDDRRELIGRCFVQARDDVAVGVERDRDVRVAKPLAHDLRMDAGAERERGRGVPQIVQSDDRQTEPAQHVAEGLGDVLRVQGPTIRLGEHEVEGVVERWLKGR